MDARRPTFNESLGIKSWVIEQISQPQEIRRIALYGFIQLFQQNNPVNLPQTIGRFGHLASF